jgi:hypothetical protein
MQKVCANVKKLFVWGNIYFHGIILEKAYEYYYTKSKINLRIG